MKKPIYLLILLIPLGACQKIEIPIEPPIQHTLTRASVDVGSDYRWQIYFELTSVNEQAKNLKTDWDLAFSSQETSWQVYLNSAKLMFVSFFHDQTFANKTDTLGFQLNQKMDNSAGKADSTAIGDWRNQLGIYLIDRGYDPQGLHLGFSKLQIISYDNSTYQIRIGTLADTNGKLVTINKNSQLSFVHFSLSTNTTVSIMPIRTNWDLCFSQYTHLFPNENPPLPYLVVGSLLNPYQTKAALITGYTFEEIDLFIAQQQNLSTDWNAIGYDWKSFSGSWYLTHSAKTYVIQTQDGSFYKLRFLDFYGPTGNKGNILFEYIKL